jgi:putative oxidoreductase
MNQALNRWASIPLRLAVGFGFIYHGFPKLFSSDGHSMFVSMLEGLDVPAATFTAWAVGALEFFGGIALIVGALVPIVSILLIANMVVALFKVHLAAGFSFMNMTGMTDTGPQFGMPGYEVNVLYIASLAALALLGYSELSVDHWIADKRRNRETGGR